MVTLICPAGSADAGTPISQGDHAFPPYRLAPDGPWLIDVPPDVAEHFILNAGFIRMPKKDVAPIPDAPAYMAKLRHPSGAGCSFDGVEYAPDEEGFVHVPHAAVRVLASHGFVPAGAAAPAAPDAAGHAIDNDGGVQPIVPRKDFPPDPPGTPHPEARITR